MKHIKNIITRELSPLAVDPYAPIRPYLSFQRAPVFHKLNWQFGALPTDLMDTYKL